MARAFVDQCMELHQVRGGTSPGQVGKLGNEMASMAKYWVTDLENKVTRSHTAPAQGGRRLPAAPRRLGIHVGDQHRQGLRQRQGAGAGIDSSHHTIAQTIYGGTNEIMKELIARSIVKDN